MNRLQCLHSGKCFFLGIKIMVTTFFIILATMHTGNCDGHPRILVMPFTIHAGEDLSFLQEGVSDMLVSNLETKKNMVVMRISDPDHDIRALALKNTADYIITGSLIVLGNRISTNIRVLDGGDVDRSVLSFARTGQQHSDVFAHLEELVSTINSQLIESGKMLKKESTSTAPVSHSLEISTHTHGTYKELPGTLPQKALVDNQNRIPREIIPITMDGIPEFKAQLNGLAAGDVDGNGTMDIVVITADDLLIYTMIKDQWNILAQFNGSGNFIGVDTADVNENGREEIFITNFDNMQSRASSFILEWDGNTFQRLATHMPWYFRSITISHGNKILVGQRQGMEALFGEGIHKMIWRDNKYIPGKALPLTRQLPIFGFAWGTVRSTNSRDVVCYNPDNFVEIQNQAGETVWSTSEKYGGGVNSISYTPEDQWDEKNIVFLPPRIHLYDIDGDGIQEMMVINNESEFGISSLVGKRSYNKGRLEWLKFYGQGIRPAMQTLNVSKFIADSALVDMDGDGRLEMVVAVVKQARGIKTKGRSYLTLFPL
ncbi:hypothetical protein [Desulfocicer niacini]